MAKQKRLWKRFSSPRTRRTILAVIGVAMVSSVLLSLKVANRVYREQCRVAAEQEAMDLANDSQPSADKPPSSPAVAIPEAPIYALPYAFYVFIAAITNLAFGYFTAVMIGYRPQTAFH